MAAVLVSPSTSLFFSSRRTASFACSSRRSRAQSLRKPRSLRENSNEIEAVSQKRIPGRGKDETQSSSAAFKSLGIQRKDKGLVYDLKEQQVNDTDDLQDAGFLNAVVKRQLPRSARMGSLLPPVSLTLSPQSSLLSFPLLKPTSTSSTSSSLFSRPRFLFFEAPFTPTPKLPRLRCSSSDPRDAEEESSETLVEDLRVPESWSIPSVALQESEWLRVALHKWLDEEYCPEPANVEISKVAARSYYESLTAKQLDLGEILLKMVRDLETISYQESFHGPFSSANAAVHLITLRMNSVMVQ